MLKNLDQAVAYVMKQVSVLDPEAVLDKDMLELTLEDMMVEKIEWDFTDQMKKDIWRNLDNPWYIQAYLEQHVPNYYDALEQAVTEYLLPFVIKDI